MKIEIDFTNKTITIKESVMLQELVDNLKLLNIKFDEYKIIVDIRYETVPIYTPIYQPNYFNSGYPTVY